VVEQSCIEQVFELLLRLEQELQFDLVDLHLPFVVELVAVELNVAVELVLLGDLVEVLVEAGIDVFCFVPDNNGHDWIQQAD
jgi:hypothetical protein